MGEFDTGSDYDDGYDENHETSGHFCLRSTSEIRKMALILFARVLQDGKPTSMPDEHAARGTQYLSLSETENIIKEHSTEVEGPEGSCYAVGGDSPEEANEKVSHLMAALIERVRSNVIAASVKRGWVDCAFDPESNDFVFSVTEKGRAVKNDDLRLNVDSDNQTPESGDQTV
jgi:hypothetical protein